MEGCGVWDIVLHILVGYDKRIVYAKGNVATVDARGGVKFVVADQAAVFTLSEIPAVITGLAAYATATVTPASLVHTGEVAYFAIVAVPNMLAGLAAVAAEATGIVMLAGHTALGADAVGVGVVAAIAAQRTVSVLPVMLTLGYGRSGQLHKATVGAGVTVKAVYALFGAYRAVAVLPYVRALLVAFGAYALAPLMLAFGRGRY